MIVLTPREGLVLRTVVDSYIQYACPIGSHTLTQRFELGLSPATIRNTMSDLEVLGLLIQPHASAGRLPTNRGYRVYVDNLMEKKRLSLQEKSLIEETVSEMSANVIDVLQRTVELLSKLSNLLNVALSPKITEGVLQKIDVSKLSQDTLLVIIAVKSGMVKTITLQINLPLEDYEIEEACKLLNQRLSGLPLSQVRQQIAQRVKEIPPSKQKDFITLFVDNADQLFQFEDESEFYLSGFKTLINQPEFHQPENLRIMTELIVDRKELTQLISGTTPQEGTKVNIGEENITEHSRGLSVLSSVFRLGDNVCAIGVIGPTRMNYAKIFSVVNYFTKTIDKHFNK